MTFDNNEILKICKAAADEAGKLIMERRASGNFTLSYKSANDLVTSADVESENLIVSRIKERFPDAVVLGEESNPVLANPADLRGPLWIIDPIDGTTNYSYGHLHCAISLGFALGGELQVAVVHAPFLNETFWSVRGQGAFLNGKKISVRQVDSLKQALIAVGYRGQRSDFDFNREKKQFDLVIENCRDLRRYGVASLDITFVACGRMDAYFETTKPWDFGPACLIAREAGAKIGHIKGVPSDTPFPPELYGVELLVATPGIFDQMLKLVRV